MQSWKQNPALHDRYAPFDNLYNTLDLFASESPDALTYSLVIHTFCEMFVEDLGWSEYQRIEGVSIPSPFDLSSGHYIRISTDRGQMLYLYRDQPIAVFYTAEGPEAVYRIKQSTYAQVMELLKGYSRYRGQNAAPDHNFFLEQFSDVSVTLPYEEEAQKLDRIQSFRLMASMPAMSFTPTDEKTDRSHGIRIENSDGKTLELFKNQPIARYTDPAGKVSFYKVPVWSFQLAIDSAQRLMSE